VISVVIQTLSKTVIIVKNKTTIFHQEANAFDVLCQESSRVWYIISYIKSANLTQKNQIINQINKFGKYAISCVKKFSTSVIFNLTIANLKNSKNT
jgi:hypothetical protein